MAKNRIRHDPCKIVQLTARAQPAVRGSAQRLTGPGRKTSMITPFVGQPGLDIGRRSRFRDQGLVPGQRLLQEPAGLRSPRRGRPTWSVPQTGRGSAGPSVGRRFGTRRCRFCAVVVSENGLSPRTIRSPPARDPGLMGIRGREIIGDPFSFAVRSWRLAATISMKNAIIAVTKSHRRPSMRRRDVRRRRSPSCA